MFHKREKAVAKKVKATKAKSKRKKATTSKGLKRDRFQAN